MSRLQTYLCLSRLYLECSFNSAHKLLHILSHFICLIFEYCINRIPSWNYCELICLLSFNYYFI